MSLQFLRAVECLELEIEVQRLHFFDRDEPGITVDGQSVDASGDRDVPVPRASSIRDVDFRPVVRILACALFGAAGMDVLADPHAPEAVAALDADAPVGR